MTTLYLVRHGKASADWQSSLDPGLDGLGKTQAEKAAETLAPLGPLDMVSSPLARARETSIPLAQIWETSPTIESRVSEIVSPTQALTGRAEWLRVVMGEKWTALDAELRSWRQGVVDALLSLAGDTVVFSHFIAINAAVGEAIDDDRVVHFFPDNGSITILENNGRKLTLSDLGAQLKTHVG
jgi:broad specificity phosphatase PhoE